MPIIEWNVGYLLGIKEIDSRHKQLVQLLNETYDEFRRGVDIKRSILDELIEYADYIFKFEEELMLEIAYPDYAEHKKEHESFTSRVLGFKKLAKQNKNLPIELLWFLCNWVTHHIRETDAEFGRFYDVHSLSQRIKQRSQPGAPRSHPRTK
jgi:hemerythrin